MVKITRGRCCPQISNCTAKNAGFLEMKRKKIPIKISLCGIVKYFRLTWCQVKRNQFKQIIFVFVLGGEL